MVYLGEIIYIYALSEFHCSQHEEKHKRDIFSASFEKGKLDQAVIIIYEYITSS